MLEDAFAETDSSKCPRTDYDTCRQLSENRRHLEHTCNRATETRRENNNADLEDKKHHFLHSRQTEIRISRPRMAATCPKNTRAHNCQREQNKLLHLILSDIFINTAERRS